MKSFNDVHENYFYIYMDCADRLQINEYYWGKYTVLVHI